MTGTSQDMEAPPRKVPRVSMSQSPHPVPQRRAAQSMEVQLRQQVEKDLNPRQWNVLDWGDILQHSDDEDADQELAQESIESTQSPLPPSPRNNHSLTASPNQPSPTISHSQQKSAI